MNKKLKTSTEEFIDSLSAADRKKFDEEYQALLLSELVLARMEKDDRSVKKLIKMINAFTR